MTFGIRRPREVRPQPGPALLRQHDRPARPLAPGPRQLAHGVTAERVVAHGEAQHTGKDHGKGLAGLDEHQVRRWTSWRRWTLLAMIAHALLAVVAAHAHTDQRQPAGLIALTCNGSDGCSPRSSSSPPAPPPARCNGRTGAADTSTAPRPATSAAGTSPQRDNDLRLEC